MSTRLHSDILFELLCKYLVTIDRFKKYIVNVISFQPGTDEMFKIQLVYIESLGLFERNMLLITLLKNNLEDWENNSINLLAETFAGKKDEVINYWESEKKKKLSKSAEKDIQKDHFLAQIPVTASFSANEGKKTVDIHCSGPQKLDRYLR